MRREQMEGSLFKRDVLPKPRKTPGNKTLRSSAGSIDTSVLETSDFAEDSGYTMGIAGNYYFGNSTIEHYTTPAVTDFAENELSDNTAQLFGGRRLTMEQKSLWELVGNQASGYGSAAQKRSIQNFIINNKRAGKVAHELINLRRKSFLSSEERIKKMKLESEAAKVATAFARELRN